MGQTFRNITVASTSDFGDKTDKIKNWVEHAGGTFSKDVTLDVTHLVASKKAWKRYHPLGKSSPSFLDTPLKLPGARSWLLSLEEGLLCVRPFPA